MRLFPPPQEGLHPAFPKRDDASSGNSALSVPCLSAGPLGAGTWLVASLFRKPAYRYSIKAAAYSFVATSVLGAAAELGESVAANAFLQQQGIEMHRSKFVEGFGTFAIDDAA